MITSYVKHDDSKVTLGFWTYLMTDCILFAGLFATYIVLRGNAYGGSNGADLFNMPSVLAETLILLTSSFTCGLAILAARQRRRIIPLLLLAVTFLLGLSFLTIELTEFRQLVADGHSWQASAFLSAFFTLVGTHGLHITIGLIWLLVVVWQIVNQGFTDNVLRRLTLFSLFWHFLDIIWIFIFSIVYLMGVV